MATIQCKVGEGDERCKITIEVLESVSEHVSYICKNHPRAVQLRAAGRVYNYAKDDADKRIRLQEFQFDHDMSRAAMPEGTHHIPRRG